MKINIYYGGRGLIDDPTNYVINKMQAVFEEIHISVERYNLHEMKNSITTLPKTLKNADGVVLATTVEWFGIGGYMQQFLDACWLYADKEHLSKIYMCPVVMATTYGEREGKLTLTNAWEILGGRPCSGICGYIEDIEILEKSKEYEQLIEKKAENMYRTINQKLASLPASNQAVKKKVSMTRNIDLTPQESEQLSQYASDESYVQKQKEDISELASMFRSMMGTVGEEKKEKSYISDFEKAFTPEPDVTGTYLIKVDEAPAPIFISVEGADLRIMYKETSKADVEISLSKNKLDDIVEGRITFQRAFMAGAMKIKGEFTAVRQLDSLFVFTR